MKVFFQEKDLTIQIVSDDQKTWFYEIDLELCVDSVQILDYVFQISNKSWCTPQIMYDLIKEIDKACQHKHQENAQAVFCPFGANKTISWKR